MHDDRTAGASYVVADPADIEKAPEHAVPEHLNVEFLLCLLAPQNACVICKSTQKNAALADTKVAARWPLFQEESAKSG